MTGTMKTMSPWKIALVMVAFAALFILSLPLLAALSIAGRILVPAALILGVLAAVVSPRARRWLVGEENLAPELHAGLRVPAGVLMHPGHAWARVAGRRVVAVGVDDLLQKALGPVAEVDLPEVGREVKRGEPLFTLQHGGRSVEVRAPVSGRVLRANDRLRAAPALVNRDPYQEGWVLELEPAEYGADERHLRAGKAAREWFRREADRLAGFLAPPLLPTPALQDGGPFVEDPFAHVDDVAWRRLKASFFELDA